MFLKWKNVRAFLYDNAAQWTSVRNLYPPATNIQNRGHHNQKSF